MAPSLPPSGHGVVLRPGRLARTDALALATALVGLTALTGCGGTGLSTTNINIASPVSARPPAQDCSAPTWATPGPDRSDAFEYGVGTAASREMSTRKALEHLAGRLSTFIESRTLDSYQDVDGTTTETLEQEILTRVSGTRLEGWEEARAEDRCGAWWVQVRIDRDNLVQSARSELDQLAQDVDLRLETARSSALRRLLALRATAADRQRANHLISMIDVLDPGFDRAGWEARRADWRSTDEAARRSLVFEIRADEGAREIADMIESRLVRKRLRMREGGCRGGNAICIEIRSKTTETFVVGRHVTMVRASVLVLEPSGAVVQSGEVEGNGRAKSDPALARRNALADLQRQLDSLAILDGLI